MCSCRRGGGNRMFHVLSGTQKSKGLIFNGLFVFVSTLKFTFSQLLSAINKSIFQQFWQSLSKNFPSRK
jgi:hypothetical protein